MKINPGDPSKNHFRVSLVKSLVRITAGLCLLASGLGMLAATSGGLLILAEVLGIVEELV